MISAFLTALAGTFLCPVSTSSIPAAFSFNISIEAALVSIVAGHRHPFGPVIGTVLLKRSSLAAKLARQQHRRHSAHPVYALILIAIILAADRADRDHYRGLSAPSTPQAGAHVKAAMADALVIRVSANASADCALCRTSVHRERETRPSH